MYPPISRLNKAMVIPMQEQSHESPGLICGKIYVHHCWVSIATSVGRSPGIPDTNRIGQESCTYTYIGVYVDSWVPQAYVELVDQLVQGIQYICDASLYAVSLLSMLLHFGGSASASPVAKMLVC